MYTISHYKADLVDAKKEAASGTLTEKQASAKFGALAAAAGKRYRVSILISLLQELKDAENVDLTPTLASHLISGTFGRSVSNRALISAFGKSKRDASDKSADFERLDELIAILKPRVDEVMEKAKEQLCEARRMVYKDFSNLMKKRDKK